MSSVKRGFKINALNQQNKRSNNVSNLPAIKASLSHNKIKTRTIFWLICDTPECSYQNIKTTFRATFVLDIYDSSTRVLVCLSFLLNAFENYSTFEFFFFLLKYLRT